MGDVRASLEVRLEDSDGYLIQSDSGTASQFVMNGVREDIVSVSVRNPINSRVVSSGPIELKERVTRVPIGLPPDFFDVEENAPSKGTLRVAVRDAVTNHPLSATVTVVIPTGSSYVLVRSKHVDGVGYFTLDTGNWYALLADLSGYQQFNNLDNPIMLEPGEEREYTISMHPLGIPTTWPQDNTSIPPFFPNNITPNNITPELATINICVADQNGSPLTGFVEMYGATGIKESAQELLSGCTTFELSSGNMVTFSTAGLPPDCLDVTSQAIQTSPGITNLNLIANCDVDSQGRARVRIICGNNAPLTGNATINAFYASGNQIRGTGPAGSLALGTDGYTEYIGVTLGDPFYFMITNLPGYPPYTSDEFTVSGSTDRSIDICIPSSSPPESNITFQDISYPNPVIGGSIFNVEIPLILYGNTDITDFVNISAGFAGISCQISKNNGWSARCLAPSSPGEYDLFVSATYQGREKVVVRQITVLGRGSPIFTLTPHAILNTRPPIDLEMDITFNTTPLDSLTDSRVTVIYEEGGIIITDQLSLSGGSGLYYVTIDSPFPGQHRAEIYLKKITGGRIYEQNFTVHFTLTQTGTRVTSEASIDPVILAPADQFTTDVRLWSNSIEIPDLNNLFLILQEQRSRLPWNPNTHTYHGIFTAPDYEGIFSVVIELGTQALSTKKIYVVDTTKNKATSCDIANCQTIPEVRKCVQEYHLDGRYSEQETIRCIESGFFSDIGTEPIHCKSPSANRGDWDNNCMINAEGGIDDLFIMSELLRRIPDQDERNTYRGCGDMDNDGDVDEDDLKCLRNVAALKWFGDVGDGTCSTPMRGGFCFDIESGVPGDFDNNKNIDSDDVVIMTKILDVISSGITPPPELLDIADFDKNGQIDRTDSQCLENIAGAGPIPLYCLGVYDFGCTGTKGDITRNGELDSIDMILMAWMVDGRVDPASVFDCADITDDGAVDEKDLMCLSGIVNENTNDVEDYCTPCQIRMNELGRYGDEICHDGLDNDCDGYIDEACQCDVNQKCNRKYDNDGLYNTDDFKYCRSLSWMLEGAWEWYFPQVYSRCTSDIQCETRACEGYERICSSPDGTKGKWYKRDELPKERCGDGWDNDCVGGDARCPSSCFPAGTPVTMADGSSKPIEEVRVGDMVLSYDPTAKTFAAGRILEVESPIRYHLYTLIFEDGTQLRLTGEHPLYVKGKGWASIDPGATHYETGLVVQKLKEGDSIFSKENSWLKITNITYEEIPEGIRTYNLKRISEYNNFFAGGLLAHNKGGGCLYTYSISDEGLILDHLAYPFSIVPAWETYSYGTMTHLKPKNGLLKIRLSEELPEITNINHVRLFAVDHPPDTVVMPDIGGKIHTLSELQPPSSCICRDGSDCREDLLKEDEKSYIFDLESAKREDIHDAQDAIVLEFPKPASAEMAKVVVKGEESGLITFVWWQILDRVGANNMQDFLASLGSGSFESILFDQFANRKGKVNIQVWDGHNWLDVASEYLGFSKYGKGGEVLVPIYLPQLGDVKDKDSLKIRLLFSKGAFEIDYVGIDYSTDAPVILYELPMVSAETYDLRDVISLLQNDDNLYLTLNKGGWVDVTFSKPVPENDLQRSYVVAVKGYYTYDIKSQRNLTPETQGWIIRMMLDEPYLIDYVMENYPQKKEAFFRIYNG